MLCPVVQVGVVQYGARVVNEFRLDDFRTVEEVVAAARNIDQRGGEETRTALAISEARYSGVFVCYSLTVHHYLQGNIWKLSLSELQVHIPQL